MSDRLNGLQPVWTYAFFKNPNRIFTWNFVTRRKCWEL